MIETYTFPYGEDTVSIPLNREDVTDVLSGHPVPPIPEEDLKRVLFDSLDRPVDSAPLKALAKPNLRICIIVSDITRFWMRQDKIVPHLVDYLTEICGVSPGQISIVIATGTHRSGDEAELRTLVTGRIYDSVRVENHDCRADDLVYMGTTAYHNDIYINRTVARADLVIGLGAATHHVMAGFGGGRKSILPGVSGLETIRRNHALSLDKKEFRSNPAIGCGVLRGNPLHEDMMEAAGFVKNFFTVNLVCNTHMEIAHIISGNYETAWLQACKQVDEIYRVPIREKAEVVIAGCGGYPKDESLYQGTKTVDNVISGMKEGGTLVLLMEARNGGGSPDYFDWSKYLVQGGFEQALRTGFTVGGYIFFLNCEQAKKIRIFLYTKADAKEIPLMGIRVYHDLDLLLKEADIAGKKTCIIPNGATVIPYFEENENA